MYTVQHIHSGKTCMPRAAMNLDVSCYAALPNTSWINKLYIDLLVYNWSNI